MKLGARVKSGFFKSIEVVMSALEKAFLWLAKQCAEVEIWAMAKRAKV